METLNNGIDYFREVVLFQRQKNIGTINFIWVRASSLCRGVLSCCIGGFSVYLDAGVAICCSGQCFVSYRSMGGVVLYDLARSHVPENHQHH